MNKKSYERTKNLGHDTSKDRKMPSRKKIVSVLLVILGIIVAMPFNYMYGIDGVEVDLVWVIVGLLITGFGVYTLKKESKG